MGSANGVWSDAQTGYTDIWYEHNTEWYAQLRVSYSAKYNYSDGYVYIDAKVQFKNASGSDTVDFGNSYRMFDGIGNGDGGVYFDGNKKYAFSTEYGVGNNLSCGKANGKFVNLSPDFTFKKKPNSNGVVTFTLGAYGSIICDYLAQVRQVIPYDPDDPGGGGGGGGNVGPSYLMHDAIVSPIGAKESSSITLTFYVPYVVTYNANSPYTAEVRTYDVAPGTNHTIIDWNPDDTHPDYVFNGWAKDSETKLVDYIAGDVITVNKDITLYAVWYDPTATGSVAYIRENGQWVAHEFKIRENGQWVAYDAYVRENGQWKICE